MTKTNHKSISSETSNGVRILAGKSLYLYQLIDKRFHELFCRLSRIYCLGGSKDGSLFCKTGCPEFRKNFRGILMPIGVDPNLFLFPAIDEIERRRPWLINKAFIDTKKESDQSLSNEFEKLVQLSDTLVCLLKLISVLSDHFALKLRDELIIENRFQPDMDSKAFPSGKELQTDKLESLTTGFGSN